MRTIKFRGKDVETGKWLYGDLMHDNIVDCIEWLISEGYFNKEYLKQ